MHILLVADGRSPITRSWVQALLALQHQITLVSTFPCPEIAGIENVHIFPVAFGGLSGSQAGRGGAGGGQAGGLRQVVGRFRSLLMAGRYVLGPLTLLRYGPQFRRLVQMIKPDLVHALRIPFEGMLAAYTPPEVPLIVSIWGNDLTLHAQGSRWMRQLSIRTLQRANALVADAQRDIRLGRQWGFAADRPTLVVPGSGGIDLAVMRARRLEHADHLADLLPAGVPLVLERKPQVFFACAAMAGQREALNWVDRLKVGSRVRLLPYLPQADIWDLFLRAEVSVSLSAHDGTPNSLLEAMACGCFPIAGDIESLREWIIPGVNGLLVEPDKAQGLADALLFALDNAELRASAAEYNLRLIAERAEVNLVRAQIQVFYQRIAGQAAG